MRQTSAGAEADFRPTLKAATCDLGEVVEIRVRDNGTGIPPEIKDKLFQPFFTIKPTGKGADLGLPISWDIVTQQHGGTIAVDSRVHEFTEFTIRLPAHDLRGEVRIRAVARGFWVRDEGLFPQMPAYFYTVEEAPHPSPLPPSGARERYAA